jgi:hypothetical protein
LGKLVEFFSDRCLGNGESGSNCCQTYKRNRLFIYKKYLDILNEGTEPLER